MLDLESRLEDAAREARRVVAQVRHPSASQVIARRNGRRVAGALAGSLAIVAGFIAVGLLNQRGPATAPDVGSDSSPVTTTAGPEETSATTTDPTAIVESAVWAEIFLPSVVELGFGQDSSGFDGTSTSLAEGGWVWATSRDETASVTLTGVFRGFAPGEYRDDQQWFAEIADSTMVGRVVRDGTDRVILGSEIGVIVVESRADDPATAPDAATLDALANAMLPVAYQLMGSELPETAGSTFQPVPPGDDDWIEIDSDIWIAYVPEDDRFGREVERVWLRTDVENTTPFQATNIYLAITQAGGDDVVLIFEAGVPEDETRPTSVKMTWGDGESALVDFDWNEEHGVGIARSPHRASGIADVQELP